MRTRFFAGRHRPSLGGSSGQSIVEFALILPLVLVLVLGVLELGFGLLDQHVVTRLAREGANLISRDSTLQDARVALAAMSSRPVNFNDGSSKLIFTVIMRGATQGTANYDRLFVYQRHEYGTYPGASTISFAGGSFSGAPDYTAANAHNNTALRVTNPPPDLVIVRGGRVYVAEIYTRHTLITPLDRFGITVPSTLYSIAWF